MPCWLRTRPVLLTFQRFASRPWNSSFTLAFPQRKILAALVGWRSEAEAVGTDPVSGTRTASAATGAAIRAIREKGMRTTVGQVVDGRFPGHHPDGSAVECVQGDRVTHLVFPVAPPE